LIVRDKIAICRYYSKRLDFHEVYGQQANEEHLNSLYQDKSETFSQSEATASKYRMSGKKQRRTATANADRKQDAKQGPNGSLEEASKSSYPFEDGDHQAG